MAEATYILGILAVVLLMGIGAQLLGKLLKMPSIVFLLLFGIILGPEGLEIVDMTGFENELEAIVALSVAIIIFDGGLQINVRHIRTLQRNILNIITIGVLITFTGASITAYYLLEIEPGMQDT